MDDQNKGLNDRWAPPATTPERGYSRDEPPAARDTDRSTREIRSEIEQTRADMGETIDEIQERLRPANVVSRAAENVRDAAVDKVREIAHGAQEAFRGRGRSWDDHDDEPYGVMDRIREHPVPAALAAVSIAWLAFGGRSHRHRSDRAIYGSTAAGEPYIRETRIGGVEPSWRSGRGSTRPGDDYGSRASRTMHDAADGVRHVADEARHTASDAMNRMSDATWRARSGMRRTARRTTWQLDRLVHDNPLAAGALAAAVGATLGMVVPETRREDELMGETRDQFIDKAKDAAVEAKERVEQAATRAQDAAQKAVTDTLTGGDRTSDRTSDRT